MDTNSRAYKLLKKCCSEFSTQVTDERAQRSNALGLDQSSILPSVDNLDLAKSDNESKVKNWLGNSHFDETEYNHGAMKNYLILNSGSNQKEASSSMVADINNSSCSIPQDNIIISTNFADRNWLGGNHFDETEYNQGAMKNDLTLNSGSNQNDASSLMIEDVNYSSCSILQDNIIISTNFETNIVGNAGSLSQNQISGSVEVNNPNSSVEEIHCVGVVTVTPSEDNNNSLDIESMEVVYSELENVTFGTEKIPSTALEAASNNDSDYAPEEHNLDSDQSLAEDGDSVSSEKEKNISKSKRKFLRNRGETYTTVSGKLQKKKTLQPLQPCRNKCAQELDEEIRESLFSEYWSLGSYDKRTTYVANLINIEEKKIQRAKQTGKKHKIRNHSYKYNFKYQNRNITACKTCFLKTLDETPKFVQVVVKNKLQSVSGTTHSDLRGKHAPANKLKGEKLKEIRDHILSFPAYESHYSRRHTSKKYLGSNLNLTVMYDLYCNIAKNPVCRPIYVREFHKLGLRFKKPAIDTCTTCDRLAVTLKNLEDDFKAEEELKLRMHQEEADSGYDSKKNDKEKAKTQTNLKVYTFDLQQVLPTPFLTSGNVFYKRQLSTYNLTIHDCITGNSHHYMWYEAVARRGSNEIASCLYNYILNVIPSNVEHAVFYSDTCGGQNKNSTVIAMFTYVLNNHHTLQIIEHKFLTPGHTHMECDADHAAIERKSKRAPFPIQTPRDWYNLVRLSGRKHKFEVVVVDQTMVFDFAALTGRDGLFMKKKIDEQGDKFNYREVKWLRFEKDLGIILYRKTLQEDHPFNRINFNKKKTGKHAAMLKLAYQKPIPISSKKKENLLSLLPQVDQDVRQFYEYLDSVDMDKDIDPDLDRLLSETEENEF